MNKRHHEPVKFFAIIVILFVLSACGSSLKNLVREGTSKVDTTSSRGVHFNRVDVYESDAGLLVRGELHKRSHRRGPIPGHVHIEIIAPDGTVLANTSTNYHRGSSKSRTSRFTVKIPIEVPMNSTIQIMHHRAGDREETRSDINSRNTRSILGARISSI